MASTPKANHLLHKHGILKTFYISKTIPKKEINALYKKLGIDVNTADTETKNKVVTTAQTIYSMTNGINDIPGLINKQTDIVNSFEERKLSELLNMSDTMADILKHEGLTPKECGFVLSAVIKKLNLNDPKFFKGFGQSDEEF